ncbi:hypothetical protein [Roseateles sp.]|uniref:hypothetical protein n=1 Tax=Roseateles sp. TaxID=1971397 RepID=UPI0032645D55
MTPLRWSLLAAVVGLAAGGAGLYRALRAADALAPVTPAGAAVPQPSLPGTAQVDAPAAVQASGPGSITRPAAGSLAAAPPSLPRVGSEGYGPYIERALAGNDAKAAWEAVQWLRQCASNEARRASFEQARNQGVVPEMTTQLMVEADAEARRCQTVTAQHRGMLPELSARAMRAGVPLAAQAYAAAVSPAGLAPAQRQEVADALRRDAVAAGTMGLSAAVEADEAWGLSDAERLGFVAALNQLAAQTKPGEFNLNGVMLSRSIRFKTPPTAEQQAAAQLAGQRIVARINAGQP